LFLINSDPRYFDDQSFTGFVILFVRFIVLANSLAIALS